MKNFFKRIVTTFVTDLKTIILAVLLAIVVWFAISLQIFPDITSHIDEIPVVAVATDYMNDNDLRISDDFSKNISVQINGKRYAIGNLSAADFYATADLSAIKTAGVYTVKVNIQTVNNVDCSILTENLTTEIKIVKTVEKTFSVGEGNLYATADDVVPAEGFKIDSVTAEPQHITLTGDEKVINSVGKIEIKSIFAGTAENSMQSKGEIVVYNTAGEVMQSPDVTMDNESFTVSISLYKQKTLPLSVQFTNVPSNFNIDSLKYSIYPEEITISSPDSSIDSLEKFEVGTIDLSQLTTKYLQKLALPISLPDGYKNNSGNTNALVTFEADNYISLDFTLPKENITVSNAPDSYDVAVVTNELTVSVVGPSSDLLQLTSSDIYATANLLGTTVSEGAKDISVSFKLKGTKTNSWVIGEYKISVQITPKKADNSSGG